MTGVSTRSEETKPRVLWLYTQLIGQVVQVSLRDGLIYEGLLASKCPNSMDVVLECARLKSRADGDRTALAQCKKVLKISADSIIFINAIDVVLGEKDAVSIHGFKTDTDISKATLGRERSLQKWQSDPNCVIDSFDTATFQTGEWDQFSANEKLHGIRSTYNEEIYTTKLDKSQFTREQQKRAEALAAEIESNKYGETKDHIMWCDDDDMDEEQAFSAVTRPEETRLKTGSSGAYVPPSMRRQNKDDSSTTQPQQQSQQAPASMPLPKGTSKEALAPSLVQRGEGPPLPIPPDCYQSSPSAAPAAQPQPSAAVTEPKKHGLEGRLGAELFKNAQKGGNVQLKEVPVAADRQPAPRSSRSAEINQFILDSQRLDQVFKKQEANSREAKSVSFNTPAPAPKVAKAPSKEVKQFMEDSARLTKAFQQKEKTVKEDTPANEKEDAKPTPAPTTTTNPAPAPVPAATPAPTPATSASPTAASVRKKMTPADWKPQLNHRFNDPRQEISRIIAQGLAERISTAKKPDKNNKKAFPVPGDVERFSHEWKGDGLWCKEEAAEKSTRGETRAPIVPSHTEAQTQNTQPMPPQVTPAQAIQVQQQPQYPPVMIQQPNQPQPQYMQQMALQAQQVQPQLAQPGTPQTSFNQFVQPQLQYGHHFQQPQVLQPQHPQQHQHQHHQHPHAHQQHPQQHQHQQNQHQHHHQQHLQGQQGKKDVKDQQKEQELLQQQAQAQAQAQAHAHAQAQAVQLQHQQHQQHHQQHQHHQHHQQHQHHQHHQQHQQQHHQHHQQLQHQLQHPQQGQHQHHQQHQQQLQHPQFQQQLQFQQRQQYPQQQMPGQPMQQQMPQQMPSYQYVQQQYPYQQYQMQPGQVPQQQLQQMQPQYQNQVTQLQMAPSGVQPMMTNPAVPLQSVEMQIPLQRQGSLQQGIPQEYRQQVPGMPPSPGMPQAQMARVPPSPAPPQANNMMRTSYNGRDVQSQLQQQEQGQPGMDDQMQHQGPDQMMGQDGQMDMYGQRMPSPQGLVSAQRMQVQQQMPPSPASPYAVQQGAMPPNVVPGQPGQPMPNQMPPSPAPPTLPYGAMQAPVHPHILQQPGQMQHQHQQMQMQQGIPAVQQPGMVQPFQQRNGQYAVPGNMAMNPVQGQPPQQQQQQQQQQLQLQQPNQQQQAILQQQALLQQQAAQLQAQLQGKLPITVQQAGGMQRIPGMQSMQSMQSMPATQGVNLQGMQGLQGLQNMGTMQGLSVPVLAGSQMYIPQTSGMVGKAPFMVIAGQFMLGSQMTPQVGRVLQR
eukprot:TRINITY_DN985_c1_g1_i5.p1 TRINITY_DN985_c1_g1~~TRINITY_DN985_c1_g1_i5.p1  ORF type:complete len:1275 (+),score=341.93 TRINITY_DN985_c1_g1_i5:80-3904(+)